MSGQRKGKAMKVDNIEKLPETVEQEMFIVLNVGGYAAGSLVFADYDASKYDKDQILIAKQNVTFNIPQNIDVKGQVIASLEEEKEKIQAETHMKLKAVQDKIDNLLAIEYKS